MGKGVDLQHDGSVRECLLGRLDMQRKLCYHHNCEFRFQKSFNKAMHSHTFHFGNKLRRNICRTFRSHVNCFLVVQNFLMEVELKVTAIPCGDCDGSGGLL